MEKIVVNNRLVASTASKGRLAAKYIMIAAAIILLAGTAMGFLFGDDIAIFTGVIFPLLVLIQGIRMTGNTQGYVLVPLEIYLEKDEVCFVYPAIDRQNKKGVHKETYIYKKDDVVELLTNPGMNGICVAGKPEYTGEYPNGEKEYRNGREEGMRRDFLLTLPEEQERKKVLESLQRSLSRIARQVDTK